MKKIDAYTLMEVTVAMLLSAVCITICYTAYGIIGNYYISFQKKNQSADLVLSLKHVLEKDFMESGYVLKNENGLEFRQDSSIVYYEFQEKDILRRLGEIHTDTFNLTAKELIYRFELQEISESDTIDQLNLTVFLDKEVNVSLVLKKMYSAENLFK